MRDIKTLTLWFSCNHCQRAYPGTRLKGFTCPYCPGTVLQPLGWGKEPKLARPILGRWETLALADEPLRKRWLASLHYQVQVWEQGQAWVHNYRVSQEACECPDFAFRGGPCKHQLAYASWFYNTMVFVPYRQNPKEIAKNLGGEAVQLSLTVFAIRSRR